MRKREIFTVFYEKIIEQILCIIYIIYTVNDQFFCFVFLFQFSLTIILAQILVNCNKKRKRKKKNIRKLYYKTRKNNQVSPRIFCENVAGRTSVSEVRKQRRQQQKTEQLEKSEWPRLGDRGKNGIYVFP